MNSARAAFLALLLCWAFVARADVAVPPLSGRVVDQTGTLSSSDVAALTQTLKDFETRKGSQIAVLMVPTTEPETIEQYAIRVAEAWKIGRKKVDDGAILVIAKNDHKLRIEVGYGLEGALTDVTAKRIVDEVITPRFKNSDFGGGVTEGVARMLAVIDGEPLPAPQRKLPELGVGGLDHLGDIFNPFVIFGVFVIGSILRATLGRLLGAIGTGGVVGLIAWFVVGSLLLSGIASIIAFFFTMFGESIASSNGGRGNWSGSGGGGSSSSGGGWSGSSSSSSDSGGFSGGGGSFGGGGASGSW
jgi:uncharacterized protein